MPIEKTQQELIAEKLYPANPAKILNLLYFLRRRYEEDYIPSSPQRNLVSAGYVGIGVGAAATFSSVTSSAEKGQPITLTGTATFTLTNGQNSVLLPALGLTAQINIGRTDTSYAAFQVQAERSQINPDGTFSFQISGEQTEKMVAGNHTVYIDAFSPVGAVRLTASGQENDVRIFAIV